jgi:hypothetical protein
VSIPSFRSAIEGDHDAEHEAGPFSRSAQHLAVRAILFLPMRDPTLIAI